MSQMYHEWWGTGSYEDKPIRGGFEALEKLHRSRWRQHFDGGQVKHISRVKIVLQALNTLAEMEGNTLETASNEFDAGPMQEIHYENGGLCEGQGVVQEEEKVRQKCSYLHHYMKKFNTT